MYKIQWGDLSPAQFLTEYWQKKPLLIKGAFKHFVDPIEPNELAGLAMEQEVESRIIRNLHQQWQVEHGPFDDFSQLGDSHWTLLVQAANNWSANTQQLIDPFQFIPNWRIDDVMISFSTPQGGVGAHVDQYDVFIIQGQGKRHWQVGLPDDSLEQILSAPDLKQVSAFTPFIDTYTEPGDLLYIPPNHPHQGSAIEPSLNYSIGFQAPNSQELWSFFADQLIDNAEGLVRFSDQQRTISNNPELLTQQDLLSLKHFMFKQLSEQRIAQVFGLFLTQAHHELDLLEPDLAINPEQLTSLLAQSQRMLKPVLGIKALIIDSTNYLYINGIEFSFDLTTQVLARKLALNAAFPVTEIADYLDCLKNQQLLTTVMNKGFWYLD